MFIVSSSFLRFFLIILLTACVTSLKIHEFLFSIVLPILFDSFFCNYFFLSFFPFVAECVSSIFCCVLQLKEILEMCAHHILQQHSAHVFSFHLISKLQYSISLCFSYIEQEKESIVVI